MPIRATGTAGGRRYTISSCRHRTNDGCLSRTNLYHLLAEPSLQALWQNVTGSSLATAESASSGGNDAGLSVRDIASTQGLGFVHNAESSRPSPSR